MDAINLTHACRLKIGFFLHAAAGHLLIGLVFPALLHGNERIIGNPHYLLFLRHVEYLRVYLARSHSLADLSHAKQEVKATWAGFEKLYGSEQLRPKAHIARHFDQAVRR